MKKLLFGALLLNIILFTSAHTLKAVISTLPCAKVLDCRLRTNGFGYFLDNTQLIAQLANKNLDTMKVILILGQAIREYRNCAQDDAPNMLSSRFQILSLILHGSQPAIDELNLLREVLSF